MSFSGSYLPTDVDFLLEINDFQEISILEKERLIQTGEKHYSEVLTEEMDFPDEYLELYEKSFSNNLHNVSSDVYSLSKYIASVHKPVLISLARAGTPYGVLIKRTLQNCFHIDASHYSISIIRDKGIDYNAMNHILSIHGADATFLFVDGWTGKGAIANQLHKSMRSLSQKLNYQFIVLSDIAGVADVAARREDYIIPSCLLNSTISGLISRTLINDNPISFHRAKFYFQYQDKDLSLQYVDKVEQYIVNHELTFGNPEVHHFNQAAKDLYIQFVESMLGQYKISNRNYFKPGLGETTRMLIRRNPDYIIINEHYLSSLEHILLLSNLKNIKILVQNDMPVPCVGIISKFQS
jgi:hypothetical protein